MINCPKCGFNQPEDHFCASCGVDMQAYIPPRPPLAKMLLGHWAVQVSLILLALVGGFYLLHQKNLAMIAAQEIEDAARSASPIFRPRSDKASDLNNGLDKGTADRSQASAAANGTASSQGNAGANLGANSGPRDASNEGAANLAASSSADPTANPNAPVVIAKRLKMVIAELPRSYLAELHKSASRNSFASSGALNSGVAGSDGNLTRMPASSQGYNSQETFTLGNDPMKLTRGGGSGGMTLVASFLSSSSDAATGATDINVEMTLFGPDQLARQIQGFNQTQQFSFIIPPKSFGFIDGFLGAPNSGALTPQDSQALADSPLRVLSSQNYLAGQSDLVVFLIPAQ